MRRLPAAILGSVASHALALGWMAWSGRVLGVPLTAPASQHPPGAPPVASRDAEPIALILLDAPSAAPASQTLADPNDATRPARVASARDPHHEAALAIDTRREPSAPAIDATGHEATAGHDAPAANTSSAAIAGNATPGSGDQRSTGPLAMRRPAPPELHGLSQASPMSSSPAARRSRHRPKRPSGCSKSATSCAAATPASARSSPSMNGSRGKT